MNFSISPRKTDNKKSVLPSLWSIFLLFFKLGAIGFGGGPALLSMIEQEVVEKRGWLSREVFLQGMCVSLIPPGSMMVNVAFFVGHILRGNIGAAVALLGMVVPSFVIVVILASVLIFSGSLNLQTQAVRGLAPAVAGVLAALVVKMCRENAEKIREILLIGVVGFSLYFFKFSPVYLVLAAVVFGFIYYHFIYKKPAGGDKEGEDKC